jgi:hypothetical protein
MRRKIERNIYKKGNRETEEKAKDKEERNRKGKGKERRTEKGGKTGKDLKTGNKQESLKRNYLRCKGEKGKKLKE